MDIRNYVIATFEPEDVQARADKNILSYIKENGLMDEVVTHAVKYLRNWYDWECGQQADDALVEALMKVIGEEKLNELEEDESVYI